MRAVRFHAPNDVRVEDVLLPVPAPEEIRIRPIAVGICGSDSHIVAGDYPARAPVVLGHEIAGVVDAIGSEVRSVVEGDLVTVEPHRYCGFCRYCRTGREHLCLTKEAYGVHLDGGLAEALVIPARIAYHVPGGIGPEIACLTEPVACCIHALDRLAPMSGMSLAVFGAGPAGCILARLARLMGVGPIVVVEPRPARRERATVFGADAVIDPGAAGWADAARHESGSDGFDYLIDAVGSPAVLEEAVNLAARGARILAFGVAHPEATVALRPNEIYSKELSILGSVINPFTHHRAAELLPHLGLDQLQIQKYPLEAIEAALEAQIAGTADKVEVSPQRGTSAP